MKPTLVFALLVLFLYTVCGESAETSAVRSLSQSRRLQEVSEVFGVGSWEVKNADGKNCVPIPYIDFGFKRFGEQFVDPKVVPGAADCLNSCPTALGCVALNYYPDSRKCETLKSVTKVTSETAASTLLIQFKDGNACNPNNFIPGFHRAGHDYDRIEGIASVEDCCKRCLKADTKCVAWDYNDTNSVCFLKASVPILVSNSGSCKIYTGLGGYCPKSSQSST